MSTALYKQYMAEKDRELRRLKEQNEALKEEFEVLAEKKVRFSNLSDKHFNQNGKRVIDPTLSPDSERHIQELINKRARRF